MSKERKFRYRVVDVFTTRQFEGNPLAVFPEAQGLSGETMQQIARELNLSETVFVLPATKRDFTARLRIFTPRRELPFAGHPTVGTSFVLFDERKSSDSDFLLEEDIGPVPVRIERNDPPMFWLRTPPIAERSFFERSSCAEALGLSLDDMLDVRPQLLDAGNPTIFAAVRDKAAVDRAWYDLRALQTLRGNRDQHSCIFVFTPTKEGAYSRMFAPDYGIPEDPATGSSTGPLALYMMRNGLISSHSFVSEQGTKMGRRSLLHVNIRGEMGSEAIEVGGHVAPLAEGSMELA